MLHYAAEVNSQEAFKAFCNAIGINNFDIEREPDTIEVYLARMAKALGVERLFAELVAERGNDEAISLRENAFIYQRDESWHGSPDWHEYKRIAITKDQYDALVALREVAYRFRFMRI